MTLDKIYVEYHMIAYNLGELYSLIFKWYNVIIDEKITDCVIVFNKDNTVISMVTTDDYSEGLKRLMESLAIQHGMINVVFLTGGEAVVRQVTKTVYTFNKN